MNNRLCATNWLLITIHITLPVGVYSEMLLVQFNLFSCVVQDQRSVSQVKHLFNEPNAVVLPTDVGVVSSTRLDRLDYDAQLSRPSTRRFNLSEEELYDVTNIRDNDTMCAVTTDSRLYTNSIPYNRDSPIMGVRIRLPPHITSRVVCMSCVSYGTGGLVLEDGRLVLVSRGNVAETLDLSEYGVVREIGIIPDYVTHQTGVLENVWGIAFPAQHVPRSAYVQGLVSGREVHESVYHEARVWVVLDKDGVHELRAINDLTIGNPGRHIACISVPLAEGVLGVSVLNRVSYEVATTKSARK